MLVRCTIAGVLAHPPILVHQLAEQYERLKANDREGFRNEYESIDPGQQFTWDVSNHEMNRCKNRYANVVAYDHSRVILDSLPGVPNSDYINANFVDGYHRQNAYIATQVIPLVVLWQHDLATYHYYDHPRFEVLSDFVLTWYNKRWWWWWWWKKSIIWYPASIRLLKVDSDAALLPSWFNW